MILSIASILSAQDCGHRQKKQVHAMLTSLFIHLNYSRIIFLSPSYLEEPNQPFFELIKREFLALLETSAGVCLPSVLQYTEDKFQQNIKTIVNFQDSAIIVLVFNKSYERLLKARVPGI